MKSVRTWARLGGVLLLGVSVLACHDEEPWTLPKVDGVSTRGDAPEAGGSADDDSKQGHDAGSDASDAPESDREERDSRDVEAEDYGTDGRRQAEWRPSDAQIVKLLAVASKAEIAQANAALPTLSDRSIRAFAGHMVEAHSAAQARHDALLRGLGAAPIASVLSSNVEYEATGVIARLQNAAPDEIDRFYIDSQITAHYKVLSTLDRVLIPNAQDARLQSELDDTRAEAQAHLDEAEELGRRPKAIP